MAGDLDRAARHAFWLALEELLNGDPRLVQVHLGAVTFLDAAGLTALLRAQREAAEAGVQLVLVAPSVSVLRVLDRTQAAPLFEIWV